MKKLNPNPPTQETSHAPGAETRTGSGLAVGPEIRHGTYSAYNNRRCRCGACRKANTAYKVKRGKAERQELKRLRKRVGKS